MFISYTSKARLNRFMIMLVIIASFASVFAQQKLQTAVQVVNNANNQAAKTQGAIDRLSDQTDDLLVQYRAALSEIEALTVYNKEIKSLVDDQVLQIQNINNEMETLESTNRAVVPLIIEMIDMLRQVVQADIPFLKEERMARIAKLEANMNKSNVTTSEKYRKATEAYQVELDYGRTVGTYQANLDNGTKVNFLRIGRTVLLYQTLDEGQSGWWNPKTRSFESLPNSYNSAIKQGIRIAAKQAAPDLVGLPVLVQLSGGK